MANKLKTVKLADGIAFNSFNDSRFKTNRISLNFITMLNKETVTVNSLISQVLKKGYKGCDNYTKLNQQLQELYGAMIESDVQKRGDYQVISLAITGVDDRFSLENEQISRDCAAILCNMALNPIVEDDGLSQSYVELEKKALVDTIEAELNEKRIYAINNAIKLICSDEPSGIPKYGIKERVAEITPSLAKKQYDNLVETSQIEILFTGAGDETPALETVKSFFANVKRNYKPLEKIKLHKPLDKPKKEVEKIAVSQSKLVLGLSTKYGGNDALAPAVRLMTAILGGTPSSKLFLNVREKLSLCYYCAARYDMSKAVILIDSGVETENIEKAKEEILAQLDLIKKGDFTEEEYKFALLSLKNSYSSVYESDSAIESYYLGKIISGVITTPDEEIAKLDAATREDIIEAAGAVQLDAVYILTELDK